MKKLLLLGVLGISMIAAKAENYSLVSVSYDATTLMANEKGMLTDLGYDDRDKSGALNGFGVQYTYGFGIKDLPMNVELGLKFSTGFLNKSLSDQEGLLKTKTSLMRLAIPVSYVYHFNINDKFTLSPYAGLDFRFNLLANTKYSFESAYDDDYDLDETFSWFDKDDMGPVTAKRFQMGWHIGLRCEIQRIFLALEGGTDFIPFYSESYNAGKKTKKYNINTGNFALSIGYKF